MPTTLLTDIVAPSSVVILDGTQTLTNKTLDSPIITGGLNANSSYGTSGQVLSSTGTGIQWITLSGGGGGAAIQAIAGDTGTDNITVGTDTITFVGGTGLTTAVTNNTVTFDIDSTVATLTGSQTLTNKTISLANNTLTATSAELATAISDETGSGSLVFATSPTLVTPVLGVASATTINKVTITAPATGSTLTIAEGKTLTASNTLTFTGTDSSSVAFGAGGTVAYVADKLSAFAATTSAELAGVISDETGTGALVFGTSPTISSPTVSGNAVVFSDTTDATSSTNAPVEFAGGVGIAKKLFVGGNADFDGNVLIDGNLTISGTTNSVSATNLSVTDNMIYMNQAVQSTITNVVGNGTNVVYTTTGHNYLVNMSVTITGIDPSAYNLSNQTITAVSGNDFTIANAATGSYVSGGTARARTNANPDLGFAFGYYDTTYQHGGLFRDATDGVFKFFKGYTIEPDISAFINTADPSFAIADVQTAALTTTSISDSGNLTFTGTGPRIRADMNNATAANRLAFQNSVTNASTTLEVIPNGTSTTCAINLESDSELTNASIMQMRLTSAEVQLTSTIRGTGTYLPITMYTSGSERLRIDTSGNVGIGLGGGTPSVKLDIAQNTAADTQLKITNQYSGAAYAANIKLQADNATGSRYNALQSYSGATAQWQISGGGSDSTIAFGTGSSLTERMRIDSSGNVGIGNSATNRLSLTYDPSGGGATIGPNSTGGSTFLTLGTSLSGTYTERMRIDSSGNVGIGLGGSTATRKLVVNDGSAATTVPLQVSNGIGGTAIAKSGIDFNAHGVNFANIIGGQQADNDFAGGNLTFSTRVAEVVTEKMRITAQGGISFGATGTNYGDAPAANQQRLEFLMSEGNASPSWSDRASAAIALALYNYAR